MASSDSLHPSILWAQRNDTILLTIEINDIRDEKFSINESTLTFSGVGGVEGNQYKCTVEFMKEVIPQESKQRKTARGLYLVIKKKESGPYWSRLTSDSRKVPYIHTDFNRWKDEDEDDSDEDGPGSDPSMQALMQQMGGLGGGGGGAGGANGKPDLGDLEDDTDSDDEPLPDLES